MALITCPDCGTEVSDAAIACPKCGRPIAATAPAAQPAPKKSGCGWLVGMVIFGICVLVLLASIGGVMRNTADTATDPAPGIARIGRARVEKSWKDLKTTPGFESSRCNSGECVVMFDPQLWSQAPYDLKRDITAGLGLALAFGEHAKFVEIHDNITNKKLSQYSVHDDRTTVEQ